MELQDRLEELREQGLGVAAISFDSEAVLADFSQRRGITFPLLSDDDSKVITEFGILNTVAYEALEEIGPGRRDPTSLDPAFEEDIAKYVTFGASTSIGFHVGTPFPGTFMLDRMGRVTSRFFEEFYRERNTTANIMLKLGAGLAPIAAVEGSTSHLKFTAYPSDPYVNPGSRFSVAIRVEPNPDIHVYAPGAETMGYRVVSLNLRPVPHVRFEPVEFPESEIYYFEPLDERVPAYQSPFTLLQEVTVDATNEALEALSQLDALTLSGTFDYQACNDELCFEPVSLPVSFTLDLEALDRQLSESSPLRSAPRPRPRARTRRSEPIKLPDEEALHYGQFSVCAECSVRADRHERDSGGCPGASPGLEPRGPTGRTSE